MRELSQDVLVQKRVHQASSFKGPWGLMQHSGAGNTLNVLPGFRKHKGEKYIFQGVKYTKH